MFRMRKMGLGVVVLGCLAATAQADIFHSKVKGTAAFAMFDHTSVDGCVHTSGLVYGVSSDDGNFVLAFANRDDVCAGTPTVTYGGFADVATYTSNGLSSATLSGTVIAPPIVNGPEPALTFEFSLALTGTGGAIVENSHFTSGGGGATVSFQSTRRRAANVSGSLTMDGDALAVTGWLYGECSGDLSVVHL